MTDIPLLTHLPRVISEENSLNLCNDEQWEFPKPSPGQLLAKCPDCLAIIAEKDEHTTEAWFRRAEETMDELEGYEGPTFEQELVQLINKHSREAKSDTADLILADFIMRCLEAFEVSTRRRDTFNALPPQVELDAPTDNDAQDC